MIVIDMKWDIMKLSSKIFNGFVVGFGIKLMCIETEIVHI